MTDERQQRVAVIGGGITGLSAARHLVQHAPHTQVLLIESTDRLGGKIITERVDDFVIEGGPDSFLSRKPRGVGLASELGLRNHLHGTNESARRTYVSRHGRLYRLPEGLSGLIPSRLAPLLSSDLLSPLGKLRMGLDYFIPPRRVDEEESLGAFMRRRFGAEAYECLIEPLLSGIYGGDGDQLSLDATFPNLRQAEREHGGLIKHMLAVKQASAQPTQPREATQWPPFVTLHDGMGELIGALEAELNEVDIRRCTRVTRIAHEPGHPGYRLVLDRGETLAVNAMILATPAFITADLVSDIAPEAAQALRQIPYASVATLSLAYPLSQVPHPLDGYGYIVPRSEAGPVLACTWTSTKYDHRAPQGMALLRAFVGRAGSDGVVDRSDEDLLQVARQELGTVLGITAPPHLYRVFRWAKGMPQYTLGHLGRLEAIEHSIRAHPGLFVAGSAYRGVGIPDCITSGESAAVQAIDHLATLAIAEVITT